MDNIQILALSGQVKNMLSEYFEQCKSCKSNQWVEKNAINTLPKKALQGGRVIEFACGDGFNSRNFCSLRSQHVIVCDYDPQAVAITKSKNIAPNVSYILADICHDMSDGKFDNIMLDAALEQFNADELQKNLKEIKSRLTTTGILSGHSVVKDSYEISVYSHNKLEFESKEESLNFLSIFFKKLQFLKQYTPNAIIYIFGHPMSVYLLEVVGQMP